MEQLFLIIEVNTLLLFTKIEKNNCLCLLPLFPKPGPYTAGGQGGQLPPPGKLIFFF